MPNFEATNFKLRHYQLFDRWLFSEKTANQGLAAKNSRSLLGPARAANSLLRTQERYIMRESMIQF